MPLLQRQALLWLLLLLLPSLTSATQSLPRIRILSPASGAVYASPLRFYVEIPVNTRREFARERGDDLLCIEVDRAQRECEPAMTGNPVLPALSVGFHSATVFLVKRQASATTTTTAARAIDWSRRAMESQEVHFEILSTHELQRHRENRKRDERTRLAIDEDTDLITWSSRRQLLIGVKTSVLHNFAARQAIRDTWGDKHSLERLGVKLLFVGCRPVFHSARSGDVHRQDALRRAVELERRQFRDLLTHELECDDAYASLPNKVKQFFHFASSSAAYASAPYVMVADDDIYLRVGELVRSLREHGPRTKFYAGQVWAKQFDLEIAPNRDASHRNFLSEQQYPMFVLPPFAFGPHSVLSMDCVEYIASNRDVLGDLLSLDDVSVALWLLALQVHPEHIPSFQNLRGALCSEGLVSLADLTPFAMRVIHMNVKAHAPYCRGFDIVTWLK